MNQLCLSTALLVFLGTWWVKPGTSARVSPGSLLFYRLGTGDEGSPWKMLRYRHGVGAAKLLCISSGKFSSLHFREIP